MILHVDAIPYQEERGSRKIGDKESFEADLTDSGYSFVSAVVIFTAIEGPACQSSVLPVGLI
jgi:hypothetical protein